VPYPTAPEIRTRLAALTTGRAWCRIFSSSDPAATVPHFEPSVLGVEWTCLKISKTPSPTRAKALITGGVHANEWAPPPAVLSCFEALLAAYDAGTPITYGTFSVSPAQVHAIVDNIDIYVAPLVNPDGFNASHSAPPADQLMGRKNGRHVAAPAPDCYDGININRNFDVVWDYQVFYAPTAEDTAPAPPPAINSNVASSKTACHHNYIGTAAASEPETRNVKILLDEGVQFYIDCHMFGPDILHSWGIESNQSIDTAKNFRNAAFNGLRDGTTGTTPYAEHITTADESEITTLAGQMATAITSATTAVYTVEPGALLYPTSGAADDYAYSRHFVDATKPRVIAFTLECGSSAEGSHHPDFTTQYPKIEKEVHAAILSMLTYVSTWVAPAATTSTGTTTPASRSGRCCLFSILAGTVMQPALMFLYDLRNIRFRESARGRRFIDFVQRVYNVVSPPAAGFFVRHDRLRKLAGRCLFGPAVAMLRAASNVARHLPSPELRVDALIAATLLVGALCLAALTAVSAVTLWLLMIAGGAHA
jgi:hypothetical protein